MSASKPKIRCAIYTRKSTSAGLDQAFNSLDAQREACVRYIEARSAEGWLALSTHYDDGGFTGASLDRPAFLRLLADIEAGAIDLVVVYKVDRLSRSLLHFAQVMERFSRHGAAFVSVTQNFSTADAMGRLTLNMLMSFAEFEREMIAERTRDKIAASRRKGKWTGGVVPFGYEVVDHQLRIRPDQAETVRKIYRRYLSGTSALGIAVWLNEAGVPRPSRSARPHPWTKDLVLRILRNPIYAGLTRSQGELHPGEHEPLVDRLLQERALGFLEPKARRKRGECRNASYLVRGTLKCGACGSVMTSATTRRNGRTYRYYRCVTRGKQGTLSCATRQIPAEALEGFVVDQLRQALREGRISSAPVRARLHQLQRLVEELENAPYLQVEDGSGAGSSAERIARRRQRLELEDEEATLHWVLDALERFDQRWEIFTPENRRKLVRALVEEVRVDEDAGQVTVRLASLGVAS